MPVLTHADALTVDELEAVRQALAVALANDDVFGLYTDDVRLRLAASEWSSPQAQTPPLSPRSPRSPPPRPHADLKSPGQGQGHGHGHGNTPSPPTPALTDRSGRSTPSDPSHPQLPYAVFTAPRTFAWGTAVPRAHSDMVVLKDAILDSASRARSSTREVLYETYRTERLLAHRARKGISEESDS